jgi:hypothetical protein
MTKESVSAPVALVLSVGTLKKLGTPLEAFAAAVAAAAAKVPFEPCFKSPSKKLKSPSKKFQVAF